ncbi:MAG: DUF5615 family PIN-like protein [Nitrospirota bacterium]|nr:DUF5615 family PIN-like protein [Nitrospirota bacterium]MDE3244358.1 DUF5615 family PIN-like protein [Nitrospirota bacterium]
MKVPLDENFPLPLYHRLRAAGHDVEHVIVLGKRGAKDAELRRRIEREDLVFLTQDTEFADIPANYRGKVVISRVRQNLPIRQRVDLWCGALERFLGSVPPEKLFDLYETGKIVPWEIHESE